ncbi:MAG: hypothetical protein JNL72_05660 [Flavipsychrobacter sp.]|nr:hypothetical protein [Flavipsychrobacter sp.]
MKRAATYFFLLMGLGLACQLWAQDKNKEAEKKAAKAPTYPVFLGNSNISGKELTLPKRVFDSLMLQGLTARDSAGNPLQFHGFVFTYGERNLYEDSVGNLIVLTDWLTEYCPGNKLAENVINNNFLQRTKGGDTAYIDEVKLVDDKDRSKLGRGMRIVLTK